MTTDSVLYETASKKCKNSGGTLATSKKKDTNDFLLQEMKSLRLYLKPMWVGMHDKKAGRDDGLGRRF